MPTEIFLVPTNANPLLQQYNFTRYNKRPCQYLNNPAIWRCQHTPCFNASCDSARKHFFRNCVRFSVPREVVWQILQFLYYTPIRKTLKMKLFQELATFSQPQDGAAWRQTLRVDAKRWLPFLANNMHDMVFQVALRSNKWDEVWGETKVQIVDCRLASTTGMERHDVRSCSIHYHNVQLSLVPLDWNCVGLTAWYIVKGRRQELRRQKGDMFVPPYSVFPRMMTGYICCTKKDDNVWLLDFSAKSYFATAANRHGGEAVTLVESRSVLDIKKCRLAGLLV